MDLSQPDYGVAKEYDAKIFDLQKDIEELERQFGFKKDQAQQNVEIAVKNQKRVRINEGLTKKQESKSNYLDEEDEQPQIIRPAPIPMNTTKYLNQQTKQNRYSNLVSIKPDQPKLAKKNPEISEKWQEVFAQKPDLMKFYKKDEFDPVDFNKRDFQTNIHLQKENEVFNDYMNTFALTNL
ncbi:hypothetical protein ABPG74_000901 [Tetrahymena malaccensis]